MIVIGDALEIFGFSPVADVRVDVPAVAFMLPDVARHCGAFVFAHEVVAATMLDAYGWEALQADFPKCIDEGVNSLTMPDDGAIRERHLHAFRHVLNTLCGLTGCNSFWLCCSQFFS